MKNFKKLLAIVLAISMVLSFAACGNPTPEKSSDDSVNSTPVGLHEDENGDIDLDDLALEDPETIINILDPDIDTSKLSDKEAKELKSQYKKVSIKGKKDQKTIDGYIEKYPNIEKNDIYYLQYSSSRIL